MREFFRGWKRKLGIVTLLMACVLTAGWLRSMSRHDFCCLAIGNLISVGVVAGRGSITVTQLPSGWPSSWNTLSVKPPPGYPAYFKGKRMDEVFAAQIEEMTAITLRSAETEWAYRASGVGYGLRHERSGGSKLVSVFQVPYWSIVVPLTIASSWLLLSRPRTKKTKLTSDHRPWAATSNP